MSAIALTVSSERSQALQPFDWRGPLVLIARRDGYHLGMCNRHWTAKDYTSAEEYHAWLRGWRQGQADRWAGMRGTKRNGEM